MRRRIAFALACALTGACLFPSLSDLEGDAGDAQTQPDVVITTDASTPFCSGVDARLCEDFDEHPFASQFTSTAFSPTTDAGADDAAFTSPPMSFFAHLAGQGSGHVAYMSRTFTGTATVISYAVSVRVDQWVTGDVSGVLGTIFVDVSAADHHELSFYVTDARTALQEAFATDAGDQFIDHKFSTPITLGQWARVTFQVDLGHKTCAATLNGVSVIASCALDPSWPSSGTPFVQMGISYVAAETAPWTVRYDDVVIDWN